MKKVVCALATLAFIGSINVVSADDSTRFRLNGNSIYDQPYGDRNEFPCPDRLGSCTMTDEDYRSTRKGQSLELLKGTYFDRVDDMPKYIKYRVSTLSGNIAGDYKDYLPQKTEVVNDIIVTYRMVDDFVYLASWEHGGQNHVFLFNEPVSVERAREMINSVGTN